MLCGRTSSIITATLSLLLAIGMHMAPARHASTAEAGLAMSTGAHANDRG
jgi:hypothetical protein